MHLGSRSLIVPTIALGFALTAQALPSDTWAGTGAVSLGSGVVAVSLMAMAAVLAARWKIVESCFDGLDRVYDVHKWLGVWALVFASVHLVFKAGAPEWQTEAILKLPPAMTRTVRQLSFVALMVIVLLALNRRIPYRTWRWWHKLSGPLFLIVIAHWLSFRSPIALGSPAGLWLAGLSGLGVTAAAYKLLLYPFVSQHAEYQVRSVSANGHTVHMDLDPIGRTIAFRPGQFAFVAFERDGLREPHPFTLAGAERSDGSIAVLIRSLGDYTERLVKEAAPGWVAKVYAPFGRFKRATEDAPEVWIAGGVGVTPFIAWMQDAEAGGFERVSFFHFFTPGREIPGSVDLSAMAQACGVELIGVPDGPDSAEFRRRFADAIERAGPSRVRISFCGPAALLRRVRQMMRETGVRSEQLRYELFEFR